MKPTYSGIYQIVSPSGRRYIGSAVNLSKRWAEHRRHFVRGNHHCRGLARAVSKYGLAAMIFEVLEACAVTDLLAREQYYLDARPRSGLYNSTLTAGSMRGFKHSESTKLRMRKARVGKKMPESTRAILIAINTGKKATTKTREKMRAAHKRYRDDPELGRARAIKQGDALSANTNTTGHPGVTYRKGYGNWQARGRRHVFLGNFATKEAAIAARVAYDTEPDRYKRPLHPKNRSGHTGVSWSEAFKKWTAMGPRMKYLGRYKTIEEAVAARAAYLESVTLPQPPPSPPE